MCVSIKAGNLAQIIAAGVRWTTLLNLYTRIFSLPKNIGLIYV